MANRSPHLRLIEPTSSPEETAAIVAALERFRRATATAQTAERPGPDPWLRAAILEGVSRQGEVVARDPWINT